MMVECRSGGEVGPKLESHFSASAKTLNRKKKRANTQSCSSSSGITDQPWVRFTDRSHVPGRLGVRLRRWRSKTRRRSPEAAPTRGCSTTGDSSQPLLDSGRRGGRTLPRSKVAL
ncbi:unnamed protein product [Malus baccata var. baccata]